METLDDIRNIVVGDLIALVVETETISLHVVEPHLFRALAIGLGKDDDSGAHTCIGLEHT